MRLLRFIARLRFLSEPRRLELYPPFFLMRVKVVEMHDEWRSFRIRLPLNKISRNPGGLLFGGWQAALADPMAAFACARIFRDYSVWTRAMHIDFHHGAETDLELRFEMTPEQEERIRGQLEREGRATPRFRYTLHDASGRVCTEVTNTVAIRPKGYRKTGAAEIGQNADRSVDLGDL